MVIVHGLYRFGRKLVGFRNDYCLSCNALRRAVAMRAFIVIHLFYLPLIPLGFWKEWECSVCENHPHVHPGTRRSFKWMGLLALAVIAFMTWMVPSDPELGDGWLWVFRLGSTGAALLLLLHLLRTPPDVKLTEKMQQVTPAMEMVCPFCDVPFVVGEQCRCPGCGVVRY